VTIEINGGFTVENGEIYSSSHWATFYLNQPYAQFQFRNFGTITATGYEATGINSWNSHGIILNSGTIRATGSLDSGNLVARGIYGESWCADIINTGQIEVGGHFAFGIFSFSPDQLVDNQGLISVRGTGSNVGVRLINGGEVRNSGRIEVYGPNATAVEIDHFDGETFENLGEIVVDDGGNPWQTCGVRLSGLDPYGGGTTTVVNRGLIEADIAVSITVATSFFRPEPVHHVFNHGIIRGEVRVGDGDDLFVNTGQFDGRLVMGNGDDRADLSAGTNTGVMDMGPGSDVAIGSRFADHLEGSDGDDLLEGRDGADYLDGGFAHDIISGGSGDDEIFGSFGCDLVHGGEGSDRIHGDWTYSIDGIPSSDSLFGEAGDDTILGGQDDDLLDGGQGNDVLDGGAGNDRIHGGEGHDIVTVSGAPGEYRLLRDGDAFILKGPDGSDKLFDIETIQFSDGKVWDIARQYGEGDGPLVLPAALDPPVIHTDEAEPVQPPLFSVDAGQFALAALVDDGSPVGLRAERVGGGWECDGLLF
jgi:Ca2+-binding RTX toxin-like protein